jgi:DNA ligase-1
MSKMITRPMLAETIEDVNSLKFPVLVSGKMDGIRCIILNGCAVTRSLKPIPNKHIREWLEANLVDGLDGEIMTFKDDWKREFNDIQSDVMSQSGEPDFSFMMFDYVKDGIDKPFEDRLKDLKEYTRSLPFEKQKVAICVHQVLCNNVEELLEQEKFHLDQGQEGVMTRDPKGGYKCGRSTLKQAWLLKLKRFVDSEAEVLGFSEQMTNTNEKFTSELGLSKRSSKKEGMVPAGRLGEFLVRDVVSGVEFKIGTGDGLTLELRKEIWENQGEYLGKLVKYKAQPSGAKDKPRFPVWLGLRDKRDMG